MSNYKLSIVAAVYNLEKYLPRCLDALVNQTLQEIEILSLLNHHLHKLFPHLLNFVLEYYLM